MLKFLFSRKAQAVEPAILDDIPAHAGFVARVTYGLLGYEEKTFPTLEAAQVYIAVKRMESETLRDAMLGTGFRLARLPRFSIRNLETGKFAPYRWTVSRQLINEKYGQGV